MAYGTGDPTYGPSSPGAAGARGASRTQRKGQSIASSDRAVDEDLFEMAAHELGGPLTALLGFSHRLMRGIDAGHVAVDEDVRDTIATL